MSASPEWIARELSRLDLEDVDPFVDELDESELTWLLDPLFDWEGQLAREAQREPLGIWRVWLVLAGRGFGKTRTGAEYIRKQVELGLWKRIALVGRTAADVRDVMIEGEAGILAVSHPLMTPKYEPSNRRLIWRNNDGSLRAIATAYSAEEPKLLRGPSHDGAWADELATWPTKEAWDNLMLGLRIGSKPRAIVTTTPKPTMVIRDLIARKSTVVTGGSTYENLQNLAPEFIEDILDRYEGTSLGRQELHAEVLEEAEGALWRRVWIENHRWDIQTRGPHPDLDALVVAVDPAASVSPSSSETGIIIAGRAQVTEEDGRTRPHFFVLEDRSGRYTPEGWGRLAVDGHYEFDGDGIIGEKNNGGDMVESTIRVVDDTAPFKSVWASRGKVPRAGPVAALYEQGRVHHVGMFRELEDQQCQWEPDSGMRSPDRLDALVWAISSMMPTGREAKLTTGLDLSGGVLSRRTPWRGQ